MYEAEDPNDPLHTGHGHIDSKFEFAKKRLFDTVSVTLSTRYRTLVILTQFTIGCKTKKALSKFKCGLK